MLDEENGPITKNAKPSVCSPPSANAGFDPQDGRSLGEHLRTVHFALLTMCLLLLGTVLQNKPAPLSTAIENLKAMSALRSNSDKISKELTKTAAAAVESAGASGQALQLGLPVYLLGIWPDGTRTSFELRYPRSWVAQMMGGVKYSDNNPFEYSAATVGEFAVYWNSLQIVSVLPIPSLTAAEYRLYDNLSPNNDGQIVALETSLPRFQSLVKTKAKDVQDTDSLYTPTPLTLHWSDYSLQTDMLFGRRKIIISFPLQTLTIDLQPAFMAATGHSQDWKHGDFNRSFGELSYTQASIIFPLTFSDALTYESRKASEEASKEDYVEIFGAKLPRSSIGNWGTFILLGIQVYMILNLSQLRKEFWEQGYKASNWIGTYPGIGPAAFVVSTCIVAPVVLVVIFSFLEWKSSEITMRVFYVSATVTSIVVGFLLVRQLRYFSSVSNAANAGSKSI
jgi:hypothetical protein